MNTGGDRSGACGAGAATAPAERQRKLPTVAALAAGLALVAAGAPAVATRLPDPRATAQAGFVETLLIDDFTGPGLGPWRTNQGSNVRLAVSFRRHLPGVSGPVARVAVSQKEPGGQPEANWFTLDRPVPAGPAWREAEGVKVVLTPERRETWWVQVVLFCGDHAYKSPGLRWSYGERFVVRYLPYSVFRDGENHEVDPSQVTKVGLEGSAWARNALYLRRISLYRRPEQTGWLTFETSALAHNILERGQPVELAFRVGDTREQGAVAFRYVVTDYYGLAAASGIVLLKPDGGEYRQRLAQLPPGYYEVRAYWVDAHQRKLSESSCIKSAGTVPPGMGTFAVMPHTRAENAARFTAWGRSAFLGIHGDFGDQGDLIGLAWQLDYSRWEWLEPERPDRSGGEPEWVRAAMAEPPRRPHRLAIFSFIGPPPAWALVKEHADLASPWEWSDWEAAFRDYVRVKRHQYPDLKPRLYDVMWEPNLTPSYAAKDIVEVYHHARRVLQEEDPEALLIGPNADTVFGTLDWHEALFRVGLLDYLNAIGTHMYHAPPPEAADLVQGIARFRALIRKYHRGQDLPIYCPEMGYQGEVGPELVDHARWMMRVITIFKGEGLAAYLPFYGVDYEPPGSAQAGFGFSFNLQVEGPNPWGTQRISPKPIVSALAAWVDELEGTKATGRLQFPDKSVWGYAFAKAGAPILAVWTTGERRTVELAAAAGGPVEQVDIMGHVTRLKPVRGVVWIEIGPDISYVRGATLSR
jgi:hypothetical protein